MFLRDKEISDAIKEKYNAFIANTPENNTYRQSIKKLSDTTTSQVGSALVQQVIDNPTKYGFKSAKQARDNEHESMYRAMMFNMATKSIHEGEAAANKAGEGQLPGTLFFNAATYADLNILNRLKRGNDYDVRGVINELSNLNKLGEHVVGIANASADQVIEDSRSVGSMFGALTAKSLENSGVLTYIGAAITEGPMQMFGKRYKAAAMLENLNTEDESRSMLSSGWKNAATALSYAVPIVENIGVARVGGAKLGSLNIVANNMFKGWYQNDRYATGTAERMDSKQIISGLAFDLATSAVGMAYTDALVNSRITGGRSFANFITNKSIGSLYAASLKSVGAMVSSTALDMVVDYLGYQFVANAIKFDLPENVDAQFSPTRIYDEVKRNQLMQASMSGATPEELKEMAKKEFSAGEEAKIFGGNLFQSFLMRAASSMAANSLSNFVNRKALNDSSNPIYSKDWFNKLEEDTGFARLRDENPLLYKTGKAAAVLSHYLYNGSLRVIDNSIRQNALLAETLPNGVASLVENNGGQFNGKLAAYMYLNNELASNVILRIFSYPATKGTRPGLSFFLGGVSKADYDSYKRFFSSTFSDNSRDSLYDMLKAIKDTSTISISRDNITNFFTEAAAYIDGSARDANGNIDVNDRATRIKEVKEVINVLNKEDAFSLSDDSNIKQQMIRSFTVGFDQMSEQERSAISKVIKDVNSQKSKQFSIENHQPGGFLDQRLGDRTIRLYDADIDDARKQQITSLINSMASLRAKAMTSSSELVRGVFADNNPANMYEASLRLMGLDVETADRLMQEVGDVAGVLFQASTGTARASLDTYTHATRLADTVERALSLMIKHKTKMVTTILGRKTDASTGLNAANRAREAAYHLLDYVHLKHIFGSRLTVEHLAELNKLEAKMIGLADEHKIEMIKYIKDHVRPEVAKAISDIPSFFNIINDNISFVKILKGLIVQDSVLDVNAFSYRNAVSHITPSTGTTDNGREYYDFARLNASNPTPVKTDGKFNSYTVNGGERFEYDTRDSDIISRHIEASKTSDGYSSDTLIADREALQGVLLSYIRQALDTEYIFQLRNRQNPTDTDIDNARFAAIVRVNDMLGRFGTEYRVTAYNVREADAGLIEVTMPTNVSREQLSNFADAFIREMPVDSIYRVDIRDELNHIAFNNQNKFATITIGNKTEFLEDSLNTINAVPGLKDQIRYALTSANSLADAILRVRELMLQDEATIKYAYNNNLISEVLVNTYRLNNIERSISFQDVTMFTKEALLSSVGSLFTGRGFEFVTLGLDQHDEATQVAIKDTMVKMGYIPLVIGGTMGTTAGWIKIPRIEGQSEFSYGETVASVFTQIAGKKLANMLGIDVIDHLHTLADLDAYINSYTGVMTITDQAGQQQYVSAREFACNNFSYQVLSAILGRQNGNYTASDIVRIIMENFDTSNRVTADWATGRGYVYDTARQNILAKQHRVDPLDYLNNIIRTSVSQPEVDEATLLLNRNQGNVLDNGHQQLDNIKRGHNTPKPDRIVVERAINTVVGDLNMLQQNIIALYPAVSNQVVTNLHYDFSNVPDFVDSAVRSITHALTNNILDIHHEDIESLIVLIDQIPKLILARDVYLDPNIYNAINAMRTRINSTLADNKVEPLSERSLGTMRTDAALARSLEAINKLEFIEGNMSQHMTALVRNASDNNFDGFSYSLREAILNELSYVMPNLRTPLQQTAASFLREGETLSEERWNMYVTALSKSRSNPFRDINGVDGAVPTNRSANDEIQEFLDNSSYVRSRLKDANIKEADKLGLLLSVVATDGILLDNYKYKTIKRVNSEFLDSGLSPEMIRDATTRLAYFLGSKGHKALNVMFIDMNDVKGNSPHFKDGEMTMTSGMFNEVFAPMLGLYNNKSSKVSFQFGGMLIKVNIVDGEDSLAIEDLPATVAMNRTTTGQPTLRDDTLYIPMPNVKHMPPIFANMLMTAATSYNSAYGSAGKQISIPLMTQNGRRNPVLSAFVKSTMLHQIISIKDIETKASQQVLINPYAGFYSVAEYSKLGDSIDIVFAEIDKEIQAGKEFSFIQIANKVLSKIRNAGESVGYYSTIGNATRQTIANSQRLGRSISMISNGSLGSVLNQSDPDYYDNYMSINVNTLARELIVLHNSKDKEFESLVVDSDLLDEATDIVNNQARGQSSYANRLNDMRTFVNRALEILSSERVGLYLKLSNGTITDPNTGAVTESAVYSRIFNRSSNDGMLHDHPIALIDIRDTGSSDAVMLSPRAAHYQCADFDGDAAGTFRGSLKGLKEMVDKGLRDMGIAIEDDFDTNFAKYVSKYTRAISDFEDAVFSGGREVPTDANAQLVDTDGGKLGGLMMKANALVNETISFITNTGRTILGIKGRSHSLSFELGNRTTINDLMTSERININIATRDRSVRVISSMNRRVVLFNGNDSLLGMSNVSYGMNIVKSVTLNAKAGLKATVIDAGNSYLFMYTIDTGSSLSSKVIGFKQEMKKDVYGKTHLDQLVEAHNRADMINLVVSNLSHDNARDILSANGFIIPSNDLRLSCSMARFKRISSDFVDNPGTAFSSFFRKNLTDDDIANLGNFMKEAQILLSIHAGIESGDFDYANGYIRSISSTDLEEAGRLADLINSQQVGTDVVLPFNDIYKEVIGKLSDETREEVDKLIGYTRETCETLSMADKFFDPGSERSDGDKSKIEALVIKYRNFHPDLKGAPHALVVFDIINQKINKGKIGGSVQMLGFDLAMFEDKSKVLFNTLYDMNKPGFTFADNNYVTTLTNLKKIQTIAEAMLSSYVTSSGGPMMNDIVRRINNQAMFVAYNDACLENLIIESVEGQYRGTLTTGLISKILDELGIDTAIDKTRQQLLKTRMSPSQLEAPKSKVETISDESIGYGAIYRGTGKPVSIIELFNAMSTMINKAKQKEQKNMLRHVFTAIAENLDVDSKTTIRLLEKGVNEESIGLLKQYTTLKDDGLRYKFWFADEQALRGLANPALFSRRNEDNKIFIDGIQRKAEDSIC